MTRKSVIATIIGVTLAAVAAVCVGPADSPWSPPGTSTVAAAPADSPWLPAR